METSEHRMIDRQEALATRISELVFVLLGSVGAAFGLWHLFVRGLQWSGLFITFASVFIMMVGVVRIFASEVTRLRFRLADAHAQAAWLEVCAMAEEGGPDRRCVLDVGHEGQHRFAPLAEFIREREGSRLEPEALATV